jgi:hypothetical protein
VRAFLKVPGSSETGNSREVDVIHQNPISQARKLFNSVNKQVLSNKQIPIDIRRRLYQAIVVDRALWGSESWVLKEAGRSGHQFF